jgi:hydrogenase nickel incorporation protein HypA/HybF
MVTMHEMALVRSVVDVVLDHAKAAGASRVTAVYLTIGYGRDIVEDMMDGMFAYLARGTVAQGAELVIVRTPFMVRCRDCGMPFHLNAYDSRSWVCPKCGAARRYDLVSGMEFTIDRIEVEGGCEPQVPPDAGRRTTGEPAGCAVA